MMIKNKHSKTDFDWVWQLILPLLILGTIWFMRKTIFNWSKEPWQQSIIWVLVAIGLVDIILTIRKPLSRFIVRWKFQLQTWWKKRRKRSLRATSSASSVDQPINSLMDDQLGFAKYAYILAHHILHGDTPLTMGIHGEWGSGKTSLARLIHQFLTPRDLEQWMSPGKLNEIRNELYKSRRDLDKELPNHFLENLEVFWLNAWQYASAQSLWRALILELTRRIEEKGMSDVANKWQQKLYYSVSQEAKGEIRLSGMTLFSAATKAFITYLCSMLLPSAWLIIGLKAVGVIKSDTLSLASFDELFERQKFTLMRKQMESIEEFQIALKQLVSQLLQSNNIEKSKYRKVIFFIDDLDRCLPTVALEIMETIKTFLDVPGCVYVLLCDHQLVGQGVKTKFQEIFGEESNAYQRRGKEYIEKIIQIAFQIPPSNRDQLKEYVQRGLTDLYGKREIPYFDIVYATVSDNPRKVKRLCRGLELAFNMMQLTLKQPSISLTHVSTEITNATPSEKDAKEPSATVSGPSEGDFEAMEKKNLLERIKQFAKVYCLLYNWPDALPFLRDYQALDSSKDSLLHVPASVEALNSKKESQLAPEERNLKEAHQKLLTFLKQEDLSIFSPLLMTIDWEKAKSIGEGAVHWRNPDLIRFLKTPPFFISMTKEDLKNYVEWSGVIPSVGEVKTTKGLNGSQDVPKPDLTDPIVIALEQYRKTLLKKRGVVGVEIGEKIVRGQSTGVQAIRVLVKRKLPVSELSTKDLIPAMIDSIPVDVVEIAQPEAKSEAL